MVYIKNLDIKSFRGISSLQLSDLSPINILTGDNNCGKTSVLEIIQSYADPGDLRVWGSLLRRDTTQPLRLDSFSYYEGFYDLFDVNKDEKRVEYIVHNSGRNLKTEITLSLQLYKEKKKCPKKNIMTWRGFFAFRMRKF